MMSASAGAGPSAMATSSSKMEIDVEADTMDEGLYSRQLYVLGREGEPFCSPNRPKC